MVGCCKKKKAQNAAKLEELKKDIEIEEHRIPIDDLYAKLGSSEKEGMSEADAQARLKRDGPNALTPPNKTPLWTVFLKNLFGGFNFLLWAAAAASLIGFFMERNELGDDATMDNMYLACILAGVVCISGSFAFYQDRKSAVIMDSFSKMVPTMAHVVRDGMVKDVRAEDIVVGDIVMVSGGDKIPADIRIVSAKGLKVDNSSLTGESEPQSRTPEFTHNNPLESKNVAMYSTSVIEGAGTGIVILTGDRTVMGRIAALTSNVSSGETPIAKEIHHFIKIIGCVAVFIGISFFTLALIYGYSTIQALIFLMGIIVANVPEGITATVTVCLTLTAQKMRRKFCLVKNLEAVETLGSTSTICSDKTGTLTQNRMTVTHLWVNDQIDEAEMCGENGDISNAEAKHDMTGSYQLLLRCASLCSRALFKGGKSGDTELPVQRRETVGDASEVAILKYCELVTGGVEDKFRVDHPKIVEIPFNSTNKYQVSIHTKPDGGHVLVMKGAPEKILKLAATAHMRGDTVECGDEVRSKFQTAYETLGGYGERVLGFADLELDKEKFPEGFEFDTENVNFPLDGLRFLGLIAMIDPPRPGVPQAVRLCQSAGIKVVMVTGDHPITARAIANQVHIIEDDSGVSELIEDCDNQVENEMYGGEGRLKKTEAIVVHGEQLKKLSAETLNSIVTNYQEVVFARTSPAQKLQIVEAYQKAKNIVAVTGDGVNDAPALRKADIGIAMGIAGTDVSKQAADMILLNDNFASIVTGVEEGRLIFDNLKKSIAYTLTSNIPEITPFMFYVLLGLPLPMSIVAILMIDLGTDLWPAISLAYEQAESDIMRRAPRNPQTDKLVNIRLILFAYLQIGVMQAFAGFSTYFSIMAYHGFFPWELIQKRVFWDNRNIDDIVDSFGQEWSYAARKDLEHCCHGAFFYAIVVVQWADVLISKTRKNSIVTQGMNNHVLNTSLLFTCGLATFLMMTPFVNAMLSITALRLQIALVPLPFAIMIFLYDELRKWAVRKWPKGFIYRETYW